MRQNRLYMFKSRFISVIKQISGHQGHDYKGGLLYYLCYYEKNLSRFTLHHIHKVQGWHRIHKAFLKLKLTCPMQRRRDGVKLFWVLTTETEKGKQFVRYSNHLSTNMLSSHVHIPPARELPLVLQHFERVHG